MCLIRSVHVQLQRIIPARSALSIRSSSSHHIRVHQPIIDFQCFIVFYPGLGRIPFFELRSLGSNQHRIFDASEGGAEHILLSNKSRNMSVCLFALLLCWETFIQSTSRVAGVLLRTKRSAVSHFGAIMTRDTFRINKLVINYRTARAGSGDMEAALVIQSTQVC